MSHEFRTPLNSIMGLKPDLMERMDGPLTSEQEKQVRYIRSSSQDLMDLVNDVLDLAKVEAGKVTIRPGRFSVNTLFSALRGMLEKEEQLQLESAVKVISKSAISSREVAQQEFQGSLPSGWFTMFNHFGSGTSICTLNRQDNMSKKIILCIDDDAAGLTLRKMMLESEGYEVCTASSGAEGLALLQSQKIDAIVLDYQMPAMNGAEVARMVRDSGQDIPIVLLSGYVEEVPSTALHLVDAFVTKGGSPGQLLQVVKNSLGGRSSARITILNVDDNDEHRYAISRMLKQAGFEVMEARTGREALDMASARPTLVILDVNLPDMLGFDVCRNLKSNTITRDIPVIHISATYPGRTAVQESAESGAARFVQHPSDLKEVVEVIQQELRKHKKSPPDTAPDPSYR